MSIVHRGPMTHIMRIREDPGSGTHSWYYLMWRDVMVRPLRIEYAGSAYHITCRGNAQKRPFFTDSDRGAFPEVLAQAVARCGWRL